MSWMRMRRSTGSKKRKAYVAEGEDGSGYDDGCEKEEKEGTEEKEGDGKKR
jgi:hypothetical protein